MLGPLTTQTSLNVSTTAAQNAAKRASQSYHRADADARWTIAAAAGVALLALVFVTRGANPLVAALAAMAAWALAVSAHKRALRLQRRMWWHAARASLVQALHEQQHRPQP